MLALDSYYRFCSNLGDKLFTCGSVRVIDIGGTTYKLQVNFGYAEVEI